MAPDPKRKRGRPANASKQTTASGDKPDAYEADVEEARPNKRGRPKRSIDTAEPAPVEAEQPRRKRGRPSLNAQAEPQNAPEEPAPTKRKRGRPSAEKQTKEARAAEGSGDVAPKGPKNSRQGGQDEEVPEETRPRKRGRKPAQAPSQPEEEQQPEPLREPEPEPEAEPEAEAAEPVRRKKRGRLSLQDLRNEETHNKGTKAGRPKKTNQPPEANAENTENPDENEPKKRGRRAGARNSAGQKSDKPAPRRQSKKDAPGEEVEENAEEENREAEEEEQPQEEGQQENANAPKRGRKRRSDQNEADGEAEGEDSPPSPPSPPKPYLHVAPQTRRIRSSTINEKWSALSGASFPAASTILSLAQQPVLQRTSTARNRRQHAEAAVHLVARRVARKLTRGLPFPPALSAGHNGRPGRPTADSDGGRAAELDFESVLDGRNGLERQLGPALHAVELLRRERDKMEKELERDYDQLRILEASARAQTRERNELSKKAHVLAPTPRPAPQDAQDRSIIAAGESGTAFKDLDDPDLNSLALQLAGHVDSIRNNLQQGDGITGQVTRSRAALQDVLMRYLEQGAYEQVIFG